MSGKKAAISLVSFVLVAVILIVIAFQVFFATYEPKKTIDEQSYKFIEENNVTDLI